MVCKDLLSVGYKVSTLLGIACDGGAGYREFQTEIEFDGGVNDGIKPENFLLTIGILGVEANPDPGIQIGGEFWAAKKEGVCFRAVPHDDAGDNSSFDDEIETCTLKLLFETEDLVEDAGLVGIGFLKAKGKDLHLGFYDAGRESWRRAFCLNADFFAHDDSLRISESIKDSLSDIIDDALELDHLAVFAEMGAAFVPCIGGEKGAVGSQDLEGEET